MPDTSGFYRIQGIPIPPGGGSGLRREFSAWAGTTADGWKNSIQVSLFIRAMTKFYAIPYTDTLSYFQVAGLLPPLRCP